MAAVVPANSQYFFQIYSHSSSNILLVGIKWLLQTPAGTVLFQQLIDILCIHMTKALQCSKVNLLNIVKSAKGTVFKISIFHFST